SPGAVAVAEAGLPLLRRSEDSQLDRGFTCADTGPRRSLAMFSERTSEASESGQSSSTITLIPAFVISIWPSRLPGGGGMIRQCDSLSLSLIRQYALRRLRASRVVQRRLERSRSPSAATDMT